MTDAERNARARLASALARLRATLASLEETVTGDFDSGTARDALFGSVIEVDRLLSTIDAARRADASRKNRA